MHDRLGDQFARQTFDDGHEALVPASVIIDIVQQLGRGSGKQVTKQQADCEAAAVRSQRLVALAEEELRRRRLRYRHLSRDLFGEAAWTMLLDLFVCHHRGRKVSTTSACLASDMPDTTALRWLDVLERQGLVERAAIESDRRVKHVTLTAAGHEAVRSILESY